jgi:hypothetical protein
MKVSAWKLAPLAALLAFGVLALLPGGPTRPISVSAYDCASGNTGTLRVDIIDDNTNERVTIAGAVVTFSPDTQDAEGTDNVTDDSSEDSANTTTGRVLQNDTCSTAAGENYTVTLASLPDVLDDACDVVDSSDSGSVTEDQTTTLELIVSCSAIATPTSTTPTATATSTTPTATVTTTAGPAASLTVSAAPSTVNCGGSSFVTVVVKNAQGGNVADGTSVSVTTNSGTVSPGSATTSGGGILTIFTAPSAGGTAKITATSGSATGSADITVNCGPAATATTAAPPPVPTVSTGGGGVITPPSTGDAGLTESDGGIAWSSIAAGLLIVSSLVGGLVLARRRA